jgi:hypothetical protein
MRSGRIKEKRRTKEDTDALCADETEILAAERRKGKIVAPLLPT